MAARISKADFDEKVLKSKLPVIVDFTRIIADADANLALFTIFAFRHVWAKDVNIILWVRLAMLPAWV